MRGHGGSPGRERLRRTRVRDLVADVESVVAGFPEPPVLVGHSLGGFVVQKYLETHTAVGAVLLAPAPPTGALPVTLRAARRYPGPFLKANVQLRAQGGQAWWSQVRSHDSHGPALRAMPRARG